MITLGQQGYSYVPVITEARGACNVTKATYEIFKILIRMTRSPTRVVAQADIEMMGKSIDQLGQGLKESAFAIGVLFLAIIVRSVFQLS